MCLKQCCVGLMHQLAAHASCLDQGLLVMAGMALLRRGQRSKALGFFF